MAITEVATRRAATGNNDGVDSAALAFPNNVTSGNLLIVAGAAWGSSAAPTSIAVTDTRSTSYTVVLGTVVGTWRTFIAYGVASSSGACTVTVNPNGSSAALSFSIDEFTGQDATPADVDGGTSTGSSNTASDSITTVAANALIIAVSSQDGSTQALTAGAGYTTFGENETNSNNQCHHAIFRIATTATAYTPTVTSAGVTAWGLQSHSFEPSTGGGTTDGAGASAGASTVAAIGLAFFSASGTSTGIGAVAGIGAAWFAGTGTGSGSATASGVGAGTSAAVGSSSGIGAAPGIGAAAFAALAASAGIAAVSGVGASTSNGVGASGGAGAPLGVGAATVSALGNAAGTSTATAFAGGSFGSSSGISTAIGVGVALFDGVGASGGTTTADGIGAAVYAGGGTSSGLATVVGIGSWSGGTTAAAAGLSAGAATVGAIGAATTSGVGSSAGTSTALANSAGLGGSGAPHIGIVGQFATIRSTGGFNPVESTGRFGTVINIAGRF